MSDENIPASETPGEGTAPTPEPATGQRRPHAAHGWLTWLIIALGVLAAVAAIAVGVRFVIGPHHMMGVAALRHGYFRTMPGFPRGRMGLRGMIGPRGVSGPRGMMGPRGWRG